MIPEFRLLGRNLKNGLDKYLNSYYNRERSSARGSVVEHWLPKPGVAGSNPVARSFYCSKRGGAVSMQLLPFLRYKEDGQEYHIPHYGATIR